MEKAAKEIGRQGEQSQAEKESMSLGNLVGCNAVSKPWYTKSIMPSEIKAALTKDSKAEKKAKKKEKKRDLKKQMKELKEQIKAEKNKI